MNYCSYKELHDAVIENETQENIDAIGRWFSNYGESYWNGEYYDADDFHVFPIYRETESGDYDIVGYEIR